MAQHIGSRMASEQPLVSVLMLVYNGEKYLAEAIESILNQSFLNFEFIILDDGSTDNSLKVINQYKSKDARIRLVSRENRGVIFTRNELIELALGDWIAWMDQDDVSHFDRLKQQLITIKDHGADVCGSHWLIINEAGKIVDARLMPLNNYSFHAYIICAVPFAHGSVMLRASFIKARQIRYGDYKYAEDCDMWSKLWREEAVFINVNSFLYLYRVTGQSFSNVNRKRNVTDSKEIRRALIRKNPSLCVQSIEQLLTTYSNLSEIERVYIIVTSYLLLIISGKFIIFPVLKASTKKSIGLALLQLIKGV